jgi:phosphoenolpyruvate carboxylase
MVHLPALVNEYLEAEQYALQSELNYDYSSSSEQSQTGIQQGDCINVINDSADDVPLSGLKSTRVPAVWGGEL